MATIYKPKYKKDTMQAGSIGSNGTIYANTSGMYGDVTGNLDHARVSGTDVVPYNPVLAASQMASQSGSTIGKSGSIFKGLGNFTINDKPLREFFANMKDPALGWNSKTGLQGFGKNLGRQANIVGGVYHAGKGFGNLDKLSDANDAHQDVVSDIVSSANNNPLLSQYLTSDQISQVRNLKRHGGDVDIGFEDMLPQDIGDIGGIAKNALLGYLTGGWGGAITQGVGTAFSQGTENALKEQQMSTQELEALLAAVQEAEMQYKSMKRPALGGLGIQQRYLDMYR